MESSGLIPSCNRISLTSIWLLWESQIVGRLYSSFLKRVKWMLFYVCSYLIDLMAIPDYETLMLPLMKMAAKKEEFAVTNIIEELASMFELSEKEITRTLPSGKGRTYLYDRIHWAIMYLRHAGLLERTTRGHYRVTSRGDDILKSKPTKIDKKYLKRFREFARYVQ
jgi:Mrr N-terminal domain